MSDTLSGDIEITNHFNQFSGFATTFLEAFDEETIYDAIADALTTLCPCCLVGISKIDEHPQNISFRALGGDPRTIRRLLEDTGLYLPIPLPTLFPELLRDLKKQVVARAPPATGRITRRLIPAPLTEGYAGLHEIASACVVSFVWKGQLYGAATILCPPGVSIPGDIILEAFSKMVSVFLRRLDSEAKLEAAEHKYRNLADHASAIIIQADGDLTIRYANRHAVDLLGWTEDELVGSSFEKLVAYGRKDTLTCREILERAIRESEQNLEGEHYFCRADGGKMCLAWRAALAYEDDGSFSRLNWTALDVTDQRQGAIRLAESERRYRTIFEAAGHGLLILDDGVVFDCNGEAVRLFGASSKEEIIGREQGILVSGGARGDSLPLLLLNRYVREAREGETRTFASTLGSTGGEGRTEVEVTLTPLGINGKTQVLAVMHDLSTALRSEQALRESQAQLRMVTDSSFDAIISTKSDRTISYASPASERIMGVRIEEIQGLDFVAFFPAERRARAAKIFDEILRGKVYEGLRFPFVRPDGSELFLELTSGPVSRDGETVGAMAIVRDITAMQRAKKAELEVKYTSSLLSASLENTPLGVALFHLTPHGARVADWNRSMGKILGWQPEVIVGKMLSEVIPDRVADAIFRNLLKVVRYDRPGVTRARCGTFDGNRVTLNWFLSPFIDPRTGEQYVMCLAEDMTDVEEARRALQDSEEQYRRTIDALAEPVFVVDSDMTVKVCNRAFGRWLESLGYEGSSLTGQKIMDVLPSFSKKNWMGIDHVFAHAEPLDTVEEVHFGKTRRIVDFNRVPVIKHGAVVEVAVLMRDITAEQELEILKIEAFEQIERNMEHFAILNDHIRNPLQGILGICELDEIEHLDLIQKQVEEIDAIIRRLDMGYLESEKIREFLRKHYGMLDA